MTPENPYRIPAVALVLICLSINFVYGHGLPKTAEISLAFRQLEAERDFSLSYIHRQIFTLENQLRSPANDRSAWSALMLLRTYDQQLRLTTQIFDFKGTVLRYSHGVEIIKLLYEKLLDLDHHFTTISTFQDINKMANPVAYPEFTSVRDKLIETSREKSSISLPPALQNNFIISVGYTLLASVRGSGDKSERERQIDEIACLLDFTSSMYADLKMISYETQFLNAGNKDLMARCEKLFTDYTRLAGYDKSLHYCREKDDWHRLMDAIRASSAVYPMGTAELYYNRQRELESLRDNMNFQIHRLVSLIASYNDFITNGTHYYSKFGLILDTYENRDHCSERLPEKLLALENSIELTIHKFSTAYQLAELDGSRLRDLLYGTEIILH